MDTDDPIERRRGNRRRKNQTIWVLVGVAAAIVFLGGAAVGVVLLRGKPLPVPSIGVSPDREGVEWNLMELSDHIVKGSSRRVFSGDRASEIVIASGSASKQQVQSGGMGTVTARQWPTKQEARDAAGRVGSARKSTLYWGRFVFVSEDAAFLDEIRKALGAD